MQGRPTISDPGRPIHTPRPARPRVLLVVYNPPFRSRGGKRLTAVRGYNDPLPLTHAYIRDLAEVSGNYLRYAVAETILLDIFPTKADGFRYDEASYEACRRGAQPWHAPDAVDYHAILRQVDAVRRVEAGEVDEVWLWGPPYAGFWESTMVGRGAYFCNSDPLDLGPCARRFIVMGFNYERGVGEMLESFGHRVESLLARAFGSWQQWGGRANHAWDRFTTYDQLSPGQAGCGNLHFAPNSRRDYDWANPAPVWSTCDSWPDYPNGPPTRRRVDAREWGNGDIRAHHKWWLAHLPRSDGDTDGIRNNWWTYVAQP